MVFLGGTQPGTSAGPLHTSPQRAGCGQTAAFVLLGVAYAAIYYVALVITAVASIGGGGKSFELLIGLGLCAALAGAVTGGLMLL